MPAGHAARAAAAGAGPPISDVAWDYCDDVKGYYPYVASCKHHWVAVQASVPDEEASPDRPPAIAMWFYCSKAKGYFPYVPRLHGNLADDARHSTGEYVACSEEDSGGALMRRDGVCGSRLSSAESR